MLSLFNKLTAISEKLPERLSHPILKELIPIREIFLEQRPARLMLLGESSSFTVPELLNTWYAGDWLRQIPLGANGCNRVSFDPQASEAVEKSWQIYSLPNRGTLQILDARRDPNIPYSDFSEDLFQANIATQQPPDVAILLSPVTQEELAQLSRCIGDRKCPVLLLQTQRPSGHPPTPVEFRDHEVRVVPFGTETAVAVLCELLPNPSKLETARLLQVRDSQRQIANTLLHSFAAVCGLIGTQPIPLADLPILTSLQSFMIGIIAYCSGRQLSVKTVGEFLGAMGLNIGAGILFREGARAAIRFVPFWGNAVAGFVAGTGTYAIGKAAIAYFVDEIPITSVRKILRTSKIYSC